MKRSDWRHLETLQAVHYDRSAFDLIDKENVMISPLIRSTLLSLAVILFTLPAAHAASRVEINANVKSALVSFYKEVKSGKELAGKASGMLVFPEVYKAGFGIGGEYGEGALLIRGKTVAYYSTAAASIGLQFGAQVKSQVILFMTHKALKQFRNSDGWEAGVDGSVAIATVGVGGEIDTNTAKQPVIGLSFPTRA
jgi:lipid-binding SYLF domain-containing protein